MNARLLAYALVLFAPIGLGYACKGEGDGGGTAFLQVLERTPEDRQTEVPVDARIGFRANAPIDAATLTRETFFLTDEDGALVPSTVVVGDEADIAELQPDEPLPVITTFTVTVTTGLTARGGATLQEDFQWEFTTLDSEWGVSEWLESIGTGASSSQEIAIDGQLNALAVWQYTDALGDRIYANRYTRSDTWGVPEPIDDGSGGSTKPQLAIDEAGNGFVVWEQREEGVATASIWTNRYDVEQGWGAPALLQNGEVGPARLPVVAADRAGNAIAVWVQHEADTREEVVWANRYELGSGWGTAGAIDDNPSLFAGTSTAVGMDADGNATAIWLRPTIEGEVMWSNRYVRDTGWGTAELVKPDPDTEIRDPRLSVGANGDAFVIWGQNEGMRQHIWTVRFSGGEWEEVGPVRIDAYDGGDKQEADIAVDGRGVAHAVWGQADPDFPDDIWNLWASQYTPGSGWGTPELIESPREDPGDDGPVRNPRVGVNTAGNAFVVWSQVQDNWLSVWSNRLDPDPGTWMTAEPIEDIEQSAKLPKIAVDENRHAHAVWLHTADTGVDWVQTNRFE